MTETEPLILREDKDAVAWLTLNAPKRMNALSDAMIAELSAALDAIAQDGSVHVVVLQGAGRCFSAGHDLKEMMGEPERGPARGRFGACAEMMLKLPALPQPVIAKVHGIAAAAGCQLVAQCDLAIAADTASFATSGINLGLFCATPSVPLSRAVGRKKAMEMLFTGRFISAHEAEGAGLITRAVHSDILEVEVENLALEIAAKSPSAIAMGKRAFYAQVEAGLTDAYGLAADAMADNFCIEDAQAGIGAFLAKSPMPQWKKRT